MYNKAWTHVVVGEEPLHNLFLFWFQNQGKYTSCFSSYQPPPPYLAHKMISRNLNAIANAQRKKRGVEWPNGTELTFAFAPCDEPTNSLIICPNFCCSPTPLQLAAGRNPVIRPRPKSASPSGSRDIAVARSIVSGYLLNEWKNREKKNQVMCM